MFSLAFLYKRRKYLVLVNGLNTAVVQTLKTSFLYFHFILLGVYTKQNLNQSLIQVKEKKKSRLAAIGEAECYLSDCLNSTIGALSPSVSVCVALQLFKEHISSSQRKQLFSSLQEEKVRQREGYASGKKSLFSHLNQFCKTR